MKITGHFSFSFFLSFFYFEQVKCSMLLQCRYRKIIAYRLQMHFCIMLASLC